MSSGSLGPGREKKRENTGEKCSILNNRNLATVGEFVEEGVLGVMHKRCEASEQEKKAVIGLLSLGGESSPSRKYAWSPAKPMDWGLGKADLGATPAYLGAKEPESANTKTIESPLALRKHALSKQAGDSERDSSMSWMRESIARDLKLLDDELQENVEELTPCTAHTRTHTARGSSPVPEEVSYEDSDASTAATTPACGRSSDNTCSDSPDCEAIPEEDGVAHRCMLTTPLGPQFTCFTSTKEQTLTQKGAGRW